MKSKFLAVLAVLACSLLAATPAMAVCVDDADTFCLDNANVSNGAPIVIQIDLVGTQLTVTIADNAGLSGIKLFTVGMYNNNGQLFVDGSDVGWDAGATCCDGSGFPGNPQSDTSFATGGDTTFPIVFNLSGVPTFGTAGPIFAVHIGGFAEGCSLWLTNATPTSQDLADPGCSSTEIPEPGSLALLGTGLFSAVGVLRRKLLKA